MVELLGDLVATFRFGLVGADCDQFPVQFAWGVTLRLSPVAAASPAIDLGDTAWTHDGYSQRRLRGGFALVYR